MRKPKHARNNATGSRPKARSAGANTENSGRTPLGVKLGKPAPRNFVARISFECEDIERAQTARQQAPLVFNEAKEDFEKSSTARVSSPVHEIILERLHVGQLSESGLTITDLDRIEKALVRALNAVFHNRVRYPGQEEQPAEKRHEKAAHRSDEPAE